ncbi:PP2C family protein-serine/threonine phosphatase [Croceicoccus hydrothermalis]|uniref:PP2C family protein-serine/threonine phosphatase n=1 Tax=Croceicoccus hydrothermalis TaxID=2867964 RepID=UPI001EFB33A7|nr:SpoIIE family protein phosphatase [Croceicoccus hydrothermalis]
MVQAPNIRPRIFDADDPALTAGSERLGVLVVDDDDTVTRFLGDALARMGCDISLAHDFDQAIRQMHVGIDMVVTDLRMPGRDGMDLVRALRESHERAPLHVVMITACRDEETIGLATEAGVDDFLFKPVDPVKLMLVLSRTRRSVRLHRMVQRRNTMLTRTHERMRTLLCRLRDDLDAAAGMHRRLLPREEQLPGLRMTHVYRPATMLGGDTIGAVTVGEGRTLFFLLDVQGHGVRASLASFHYHRRLQQMAPADADALSLAMQRLNREILAGEDEIYATAIAGIVDVPAGEGWIIRAGHPEPLLMQCGGGASGVARPLDTAPAFPLGWFSQADFRATRFPFTAGARLVIYSDGLLDCCEETEIPDAQSLAALLDTCRDQPIAAIGALVERLLARRGGDLPLADDVSLFAIEPDRVSGAFHDRTDP